MASGDSTAVIMERVGSAKRINSDTPNNRRAGASSLGSAAAIKKENPEKQRERERSLSQAKDAHGQHPQYQAASAASDSTPARQHTPRSMPRTGPSANSADRRAVEDLRQRLDFDTDSDATMMTSDRAPLSGRGDGAQASVDRVPYRRRSNGARAEAGEYDAASEQDQNQIVGRLMHIRGYLKQAMARADQLRDGTADSPRGREELNKVVRLIQHLKDEEDDYMGVLQRMLAMSQQPNGSDEGALDTSMDSKDEMSDVLSLDALDMRSDISEATTGTAAAEDKEAELMALQQHRDLLRQMLEQQKQLKLLHEKQAQLLELQRKAEQRLLVEQEASRQRSGSAPVVNGSASAGRPRPRGVVAEATGAAAAESSDDDDRAAVDGSTVDDDEEEQSETGEKEGDDGDEKDRAEDGREDYEAEDSDGGSWAQEQQGDDDDALSAAVPRELRELRQRLSYLRNVFGSTQVVQTSAAPVVAGAARPAQPAKQQQQQSASSSDVAGSSRAASSRSAASRAAASASTPAADVSASAAERSGGRRAPASPPASLASSTTDDATAEERLALESKLRELEMKKERMDELLTELQQLRAQRHLLNRAAGGTTGASRSQDAAAFIGGAATPSEDGNSSVATTSSTTRISRSAEVSASADGTLGRARTVLEVLEQESQMRKLEEMRDRLQQLRELMQRLQQGQQLIHGSDREPRDDPRGATRDGDSDKDSDDDAGSRRDDMSLLGNIEKRLAQQPPAAVSARSPRDPRAAAPIAPVDRTRQDAPPPPALGAAASSSATSNGRAGGSAKPAAGGSSPATAASQQRLQLRSEDDDGGSTSSVGSTLGSTYRDDPEIQEKVRKLHAAKEKLARLQQLVKFAQDRALNGSVLSANDLFELAANDLTGDDSASLASSTVASTATTTSSAAAAAFAEKYRQSVAEAQEREELEKLYEARLAEQKLELDALAAERSRLVSIQQQLLELQRAHTAGAAAAAAAAIDSDACNGKDEKAEEAPKKSTGSGNDGAHGGEKTSEVRDKPLRRKVARSPGKPPVAMSAAQARQELARAAEAAGLPSGSTRKQEVSFRLHRSALAGTAPVDRLSTSEAAAASAASRDDLYDRMRAQRILREELRQRSVELQRLLSTSGVPTEGPNPRSQETWCLAESCDALSENMGASVASAGDLTTMATWGGSTFDESAAGGGDDGASDDDGDSSSTVSSSSSGSSSGSSCSGNGSNGKPGDGTGCPKVETAPRRTADDDGYPSDGIVQVEEEEEEDGRGGGDSDNQTYTIDEDDYQYRQRYPADLAGVASGSSTAAAAATDSAAKTSARKSSLRPSSGVFPGDLRDAGGSATANGVANRRPQQHDSRLRRAAGPLQYLRQKLDRVADMCEVLLLDQRRTASLVQDHALVNPALAGSTCSSAPGMSSSLWSSCTVPGGGAVTTLPPRDALAGERAQLSQTVYAVTQCFSQLHEQRVVTSELEDKVAALTSLVLRQQQQPVLPGQCDSSRTSRDAHADDDDEKTLTPPQTDDRSSATALPQQHRSGRGPPDTAASTVASAASGAAKQTPARSLRECYQNLIESNAASACAAGGQFSVPPLKLDQLRRSGHEVSKKPSQLPVGEERVVAAGRSRPDDTGVLSGASYRPGLSAGISGTAFSDAGSMCSSAISSVRAANTAQPSTAVAAAKARAAQITSDLDSEADTPSEFSLFEALRESIYSEVATLISQNENRPHFLIEMFRELQMLTTDYLRQRALYAVQDLVTRFLTEEKVLGDTADTPLPAWMLYRGDNSEQTPSESMISTEDEDQLRGLQAPGSRQLQPQQRQPRDSKQSANRRRSKRSNSSATSGTASEAGAATASSAARSVKKGSAAAAAASNASAAARFDYAERAETGSSLSTPPSQYGAWDSYFAEDSLEGTVIHLEKAMAEVRAYEKQQDRVEQSQSESCSTAHSGPDSNGRVAGIAKELSGSRLLPGAQAQPSSTGAGPHRPQLPADQASDCSMDAAQTYTRVDTRQLDRQIKGIMAELIPALKEHMDDVCSQPLLAYLRGRVLSLIRLPPAATEQGQEFVRFFHRQLGSILQDSLAKFEGSKMRECGEDLLVDVSEILFNELAFFRLMQDLDEPQITASRRQPASYSKMSAEGLDEISDGVTSEPPADDLRDSVRCSKDDDENACDRSGVPSSSAESVNGSSSSSSSSSSADEDDSEGVNRGPSSADRNRDNGDFDNEEGDVAGSFADAEEAAAEEEEAEEENLGKERDDEMASATDVSSVLHVMTAGPDGPPACYSYTGVMSPDIATFELSRSEFKSVARMGSDCEEDEADDDSNETADDDSTSDTAVARQAARDGSSVQSDACASYPDDFEEPEPSSDGGGDAHSDDAVKISDLPPRLEINGSKLVAMMTKEQEALAGAASLATAELFDDGDLLAGDGDRLPEPPAASSADCARESSAPPPPPPESTVRSVADSSGDTELPSRVTSGEGCTASPARPSPTKSGDVAAAEKATDGCDTAARGESTV